VLAGVIGAGMNRVVIEVRRRFDNLQRVPMWLRPALGALGVGILAAVVSNELLGPGHPTASRAMRGELVWEMALVLLALKIVVTALTVGSGGFGGVFMPSLYVGACLGTVVAAAAALVLGADVQDAGAYALVGMGAIFAGTMHAPLTPIVMLFELTHDYEVILPLMLACILSMVVSKRVYGTSFYKSVLEYRGIVLGHEAEGEVMKRGHVEDLMVVPEGVLTEGAGLDEIRRVIMGADLRSTFVVDGEGVVLGYIDGDQLARRMLAGEINAESTARDLMGHSRLTLLYASDTLAGAMLAFSRSHQALLPVVDGARRLQGVIRRADLLSHYSDKVLGEQEEIVQVHAGEGAPGLEVGLGKGLVIERVIVGRAWAGRTLAQIDLRGKTGVSVLEWTRDDQVVAVDPRKPLREGDELAVCGTREQVLALRAAR
jgi:CIC family chloride channel protein